MDKPLMQPIKIPVRVTSSKGKVCIDMRRATEDLKIIKIILYSIVTGEPIVMYPYFSDHLRSVATVSEKELLKYDYEKKTYSWGNKLK